MLFSAFSTEIQAISYDRLSMRVLPAGDSRSSEPTVPSGLQGTAGPHGPPSPSPVPPERTATLVVKTVIVNNFGPPPMTGADFTMHVNGNNPSPTDFPGSASGVTVYLAPRPYAVTRFFKSYHNSFQFAIWSIPAIFFTRVCR